MNSTKDRLPASITTDRLVLAPPTLAHVPLIARLADNARVNQMMARLPFPDTEDHARFFVETIVPSDQELCYAILIGGVEFAGIVGLTFDDGQPPQLGYWLGEAYWGFGYATEAAAAVVAAARSAGISSLASRALADNAGSRNVLRKCRFQETGRIVETVNNLPGRQMVLMHLELGR